LPDIFIEYFQVNELEHQLARLPWNDPPHGMGITLLLDYLHCYYTQTQSQTSWLRGRLILDTKYCSWRKLT